MNREADGQELTVGEVSQRTGVTVRTLHHYDAVGILPPSDRTEAGYRIYDEVAVGRLFRILALQELGLSLSETAELLDGSGSRGGALLLERAEDLQEELERRRERMDRLERLLSVARRTEGSIGPARLLEGLEELERLRPHYTPEDLQAMERAHREASPQRQHEATREWFELYASLARDREEERPPGDPGVVDRARRFEALFLEFAPDEAGARARQRDAFLQGGPVLRYVAEALREVPLPRSEAVGSDPVEPVCVEVVVGAPVEAAFHGFTQAMERWWPRAYTWSGAALKAMGIEPRVRGRCFEEGGDGIHLDWGRVLECRPPEGLVLSWRIGFDRTPQPAPERGSEVEVTFRAEVGGGCRVLLEHRHFERHGNDAERYRAALAAPEGWPYILGCFADGYQGGAPGARNRRNVGA